MKEKTKNIILKIISIIFIIWGIAGMTNALIETNYDKIFWLCYVGLLIMGIAIWKKNSFWLASQINILLLPTLLWATDVIYYIITGNFIFNLSQYFFVEPSIIKRLISLEHFAVSILSLFSLALIKLKRKDMWKISFIQLTIIFIISRVLSNSSKNINCVYRNCMEFSIGNFPYSIVWFLGAFVMVMVVNVLICVVPVFKKE